MLSVQQCNYKMVQKIKQQVLVTFFSKFDFKSIYHMFKHMKVTSNRGNTTQTFH